MKKLVVDFALPGREPVEFLAPQIVFSVDDPAAGGPQLRVECCDDQSKVLESALYAGGTWLGVRLYEDSTRPVDEPVGEPADA